MRFTRFVIVGLGVLLLSCITTEGSVIVQQLNSPADLDLSGDILYAVNFGNNGNPSFGDVVFSQNQDIPQISLSASGEMTIPSSLGSPPNTGNYDLDLLLNSGAYTNNGPGNCITYFSVDGLTISIPYELQLIVYEFGQNSTRRYDILVNDEIVVEDYFLLEHQGGIVGNGGSVIKYGFTAEETKLNISIAESLNDGNNLSAIHGFVLTEVPEPASLSLLAIGTVALLRRKR